MHNERKALYIQIQEHLIGLISSGNLAENDKIPSEKELMEQFNVSRITVTNALGELAKNDWINRIPGRGSFVSKRINENNGSPPLEPVNNNDRNVPPLSPTVTSRKMIGLIMPYIPDYFAIRVVAGINAILKDSEYYLMITLTHNSKDREKEAIIELIQKGAVGLLIFPVDSQTYNEEILTLKLQNYPFVLLDRHLPGVDTHFVGSDGFLGGQFALDHLWDLGHRNIAICTDSLTGTITVEERISGYMHALKQKGAMINPALILRDIDIDLKNPQESHPLARYIRNGMATAFISLHAQLGLFIAKLAARLQLNVPQHISIVTYDDPTSGLDDSNTFTHIDQNEEEMGKIAAKTLLDILAAAPDTPLPYKMVTLTPQLVIKHSTAPASKYRQMIP